MTTTIDQLRFKLTDSVPYCTGTLALVGGDFILKYGTEESAKRIDLSDTSANALDALEQACEPAPFGRNHESVLDPTYRKAGKMDVGAFMIGFEPERYGLIEAVRYALFPGIEESKHIRAELYKLNVYGKDAFFKSHKDTPRAENMFGSLVVVFPTPHQGGALVLRHGGREWMFDSSAILDNPDMTPTPSVAFVAFFSDVEHEVLPVQSGHRVTVTYNLYFGSKPEGHATPSLPYPNLSVLQPSGANLTAVSTTLAALLADPAVLPKGGTLGFGLQHQYPLPTSWTQGNPNPLDLLKTCLKSCDAALFAALTELGHKPQLRLAYRDECGCSDEVHVLFDEPVELVEDDCFHMTLEIPDLVEAMCQEYGGILTLVRPLAAGAGGGDEEADSAALSSVHVWWRRPPKKTLTVHMVTDITHYNTLRSKMIVQMGNEPGVSYMYKDVCLTVDIGPLERRIVVEKLKTEEESVPSDFVSDSDSD